MRHLRLAAGLTLVLVLAPTLAPTLAQEPAELQDPIQARAALQAGALAELTTATDASGRYADRRRALDHYAAVAEAQRGEELGTQAQAALRRVRLALATEALGERPELADRLATLTRWRSRSQRVVRPRRPSGTPPPATEKEQAVAALAAVFDALPGDGSRPGAAALAELLLAEGLVPTRTPPGTRPLPAGLQKLHVPRLVEAIGASRHAARPLVQQAVSRSLSAGASGARALILPHLSHPAFRRELERWAEQTADDSSRDNARRALLRFDDPALSRFVRDLAKRDPGARRWLAKNDPARLGADWKDYRSTSLQELAALIELTVAHGHEGGPVRGLVQRLESELNPGSARRAMQYLGQLPDEVTKAYGPLIEKALLGLKPFAPNGPRLSNSSWSSRFGNHWTDEIRRVNGPFYELLCQLGGRRTLEAYLRRDKDHGRVMGIEEVFARIKRPAEVLQLYQTCRQVQEAQPFREAVLELLLFCQEHEPAPADLVRWQRTLSPLQQAIFAEAMVTAQRLGPDDPLGNTPALWPALDSLPKEVAEDPVLVARISEGLPAARVLGEILAQADPDAEDMLEGLEGLGDGLEQRFEERPGGLAEALIQALRGAEIGSEDGAPQRQARVAARLLAWAPPRGTQRRRRQVAFGPGPAPAQPKPTGQPSLPLADCWQALSQAQRAQVISEVLRLADASADEQEERFKDDAPAGQGPAGGQPEFVPSATPQLAFLVSRLAELPAGPTRRDVWRRVVRFRLETQRGVPEAARALSPAELQDDPELAGAVEQVWQRLAAKRALLADVAGAGFGSGPPPHLLAQLHDSDPERVLEAIESLLACQAAGAIPELVDLAGHADAKVRQAAAAAVVALSR